MSRPDPFSVLQIGAFFLNVAQAMDAALADNQNRQADP